MANWTRQIDTFKRMSAEFIDTEENRIQRGLKIKKYLSTKLFPLVPWPEMNILYRCHSICNDHYGLDREPIYATAEALVQNLPRQNAELCQKMICDYDHFQYLLKFTNSFFILSPGITQVQIPVLSLIMTDNGLVISVDGRFAYIPNRPQFLTTIEGRFISENSSDGEKELGLMFYKEKEQIVEAIDRVFSLDYERISRSIEALDP